MGRALEAAARPVQARTEQCLAVLYPRCVVEPWRRGRSVAPSLNCPQQPRGYFRDMTTMVSSRAGFVRTVEKPWGSEDIFTEPSLPYVGKLIRVRAGCKLSLQVHELKTETMTLLAGDATLLLEDESGGLATISMEFHHGYTILPDLKHRLCAITDVVVLEVSTPEVGLTLRLEDDYGRPDEQTG